MKSRLFRRAIAISAMLALNITLARAQSPVGTQKASSKNLAPAGTGPQLPVAGAGTPGRVTKWTGFSSSNSVIGDTSIFEDKYGLVGIGTDTPTSKLTVAGMIQTFSGVKFPDGTVQSTAAVSGLQSIFHDTTLTGNGTQGSPLGLAVPLTVSGASNQAPLLQLTNTGAGAVTGFGGDGINATGASATCCFDGGVGVRGFGGQSASIEGGAGMTAEGGKHTGTQFPDKGGDGIRARGGDSVAGIGGHGIIVVGGNGTNDRGGDGIQSIAGSAGGFAGLFFGFVEVNGSLRVDEDLSVHGTKNFKIDHPLDPANKYLLHAAIESSEVLNVYSGNVTTDEGGSAVVTLPDWFEAINRDFRYQLTVVGTFAQAIIADKIKGNRFTIRSSSPNVEVSWQVTGVRSDPVMIQHPFKTEQDKSERERGTYLGPELYGQREERGTSWARNPELMRQMKERREQVKVKSEQQP
ncbi:MAG TPA: hypothetical protein VFV34_02400 [Blastocatellia bacterium]|nr:hypothetical protein [Blastocatellia bacterium]